MHPPTPKTATECKAALAATDWLSASCKPGSRSNELINSRNTTPTWQIRYPPASSATVDRSQTADLQQQWLSQWLVQWLKRGQPLVSVPGRRTPNLYLPWCSQPRLAIAYRRINNPKKKNRASGPLVNDLFT